MSLLSRSRRACLHRLATVFRFVRRLHIRPVLTMSPSAIVRVLIVENKARQTLQIIVSQTCCPIGVTRCGCFAILKRLSQTIDARWRLRNFDLMSTLL